jgi:hypothetical protein
METTAEDPATTLNTTAILLSFGGRIPSMERSYRGVHDFTTILSTK